MRPGEVQYFTKANPTANATHVELTNRGREQAIAAGRSLRDIRFDRVITSGLPRTVETARLVLDASSHSGTLPDPERWPDLEEFRKPKLEGIEKDKIDEAFLTVFQSVPSRDASYLYGESVGSVVDRVNAQMSRLH